MMRWGLAGALLVVLLVGGAADIRAEALCVSCEVAALEAAIANGTVSTSLEVLKALYDEHPDRREVTLLLASAYGADGNDVWAQRVLYRWLSAHPDDCAVIAWLAWFRIRNADMVEARELLETQGCPDSDALQTRFSLLTQMVAEIAGESEVVETPASARRSLPEDRELWMQRWHASAPGRLTPLDIRMELQTGYTSDGTAGTPADAVSASGEGGAFGRLGLEARLVAPTGKPVRPVVEGAARMQGFSKAALRSYSTADLSVRPGVMFGRSRRLTASYRGSLLLLAMADKERYLEAHRAELDWETDGGLVAFAGVGRRIFREMGRSRTELDGGVGKSLRLNRRVFLLGVVTGRYYSAVGDAYDQWGLGPLVSARVTLPAGMAFRTGLSVAMDRYPGSGGERGELAFGTTQKRRDVTVRHFDELWLPTLGAFRAGVGYEFNYRDSSANLDRGTLQYAFLEHRVRVSLRLDFQLNPGAPRAVQPADHVPLRYGLEGDTGGAGDLGREVAEMLRQEEAARAASSCVER